MSTVFHCNDFKGDFWVPGEKKLKKITKNLFLSSNLELLMRNKES